MSHIEEIRKRIYKNKFEFSKHAVDQSVIRRIKVRELREAILRDSEIIEDYPDDKYGPSCLILGFTKGNRALHIQCSYPSRPILKIITVYEPNSADWVDFTRRKKK